jgi:hypothetical protein
MTANLAPCLFCSKETIVFRFRENGYRTECTNDNCDFRGPIARTEKEALEKYNNRPFEQKAVEVLAKRIALHNMRTHNEIYTFIPEPEFDIYYWDFDEVLREDSRAEAKRLLGWEDKG